MKLRYSPTSPFVRKVTVLCREIGLDSRVERVPASPWSDDDDLPSQNPLGKVPALVLDDGTTLFESLLICEYLDCHHDGDKLIPPIGDARWRSLRQHALADGILDSAVLMLVEGKRRPADKRWDDWSERQKGKIDRALDDLEQDCGALDGPFTIGPMSVAIALDYLDFRFPDHGWRSGRPGLEAWHKAVSQRPSLRETMPREP